jgi:2-octaprenyl-6-methoxyphenol hydroxylase
MPSTHYDCIIIGGGLVGAGLALTMQSCGLCLALVDAKLPSANDPRLFALNYSSCQFLSNLGLSSPLENLSSTIDQVHVSSKGRFGSVRLRKEEAALSFLGKVIPARHLEEMLNSKLANASGIDIYRPATLTSLKQTESQALITLQDGRELSCQTLIGADGTYSTVRDLANIKITTTDYEQSALVTRTTLHRSHQQIAYERFTANGAIAMLPLPTNQCATIWSGSTASIQALAALTEIDFVNALQQAFGYRLGKFKAIAERHTFPLKQIQAETNHRQHVLLVGNAAHTLHPIAAQGFNLAVYEIAVLAEHITNHPNEISAQALAQALKQSSKQQSVSLTVSHYLADLFNEQAPWSSLAIQFGMAGLDNLSLVKKKFIERMTGRAGRVPRLLLEALV